MTFKFIYKIFNYICCCTCFSCCSDDLDNINNYQTMDNKNVSVTSRSPSSSNPDTITPRVSMDNIYNRYSLSDEENYNYVYNHMNYT
jgi:hypothetical protein